MNEITNEADLQEWGRLNSMNPQFVRNFTLSSASVGIGRKEECDFTIPCKKLSSKHCQITIKFDEKARHKVFLEDLSLNGTFVNKALVSTPSLTPCQVGKDRSVELRNGDEISLLRREDDPKRNTPAFSHSQSSSVSPTSCCSRSASTPKKTTPCRAVTRCPAPR